MGPMSGMTGGAMTAGSGTMGSTVGTGPHDSTLEKYSGANSVGKYGRGGKGAHSVRPNPIRSDLNAYASGGGPQRIQPYPGLMQV